jgi:dTDP-4-dehydrorhamnose 3,5-epimerase
MPFKETGFSGLLIFEPAVYTDSRGIFFESYNESVFEDAGIDDLFVQDNQSSSTYGVIRGLHYQLEPHSQSKLVRVVQGKILDVVVDIRQGSPTFGKSFSIELSADNKLQLYIPRGFAHGFSVLSDKADVCYKCDSFYNKASEGGIRFDDPELGIDWKIPAAKQLVSDKDKGFPLFAASRHNFEFEQ